eukprot:256092_1
MATSFFLCSIISLGLITVTCAQTIGTCCYNTQCPIVNMLNFQEHFPSGFSIDAGSTSQSNYVNLEADTCCPTGGDVIVSYSGSFIAPDGLCRCQSSSGSYVRQYCQHSFSDGYGCSNFDDPCPDSKEIGGTTTISGNLACTYYTQDSGMNYIPQRCPVQEICFRMNEAITDFDAAPISAISGRVYSSMHLVQETSKSIMIWMTPYEVNGTIEA